MVFFLMLIELAGFGIGGAAIAAAKKVRFPEKTAQAQFQMGAIWLLSWVIGAAAGFVAAYQYDAEWYLVVGPLALSLLLEPLLVSHFERWVRAV